MHDRFSTNPSSYPRWVFDGYDFGDDADVLEVGCGEGVIWRVNAERIPEGWRLTLTDMSEGMVEAARDVLGDRALYGVASVEELPFADESFDGAIANHMLFHLEDRTRALSEIRRVLRPGGLFVATAIGRDHLRELWELEPPGDGIWSKTRERFTIELARGELAPFFAAIELERYPDSLEVTDAEALVDVFRSRGDVAEKRLAAILEHVAEAIDRDGSFHVTKDTARIRCRKP
ncbi:MAG: class I SAM-dependent methyltransferase [Actinomycetota bacterium]|nr:class I SAM-dependent methyltransferase [Actinomycetota bacterium]